MHNPTTWHTRPAARALIGLIAASGIEPQTRPIRNNLSADYAPEFNDFAFYDCDEFGQLEALLQKAKEAALHGGWAKMADGADHDTAMADFCAIANLDLAALVAGEIAALRMGRAA